MQPTAFLIDKPVVRIAIYVVIVLLLANLNALVDSVSHPEIPYFDPEHLIVGGITGAVGAILFGLMMLYMRHFEKALKKIETLETFIPICSQCRKIREPGSDPNNIASWKPLDLYISEKTTTEFSHGLCPDCAEALYPNFSIKPGEKTSVLSKEPLSKNR